MKNKQQIQQQTKKPVVAPPRTFGFLAKFSGERTEAKETSEPNNKRSNALPVDSAKGNVFDSEASRPAERGEDSGKPSTSGGYSGFQFAPGQTLDRIRVDSITPQQFWDRYISKRRPVILVGHPTDKDWKAELWTDDYLDSKAGAAEVLIEKRASSREGFGKGKRIPMTFSVFLQHLRSGSDRYYLTSQALKLAPDGFAETHAPPVTLLRGDVPLVPSLLGNLVLQQQNMWMGAAKDGSSSGLHHDFHDNLYVLLRGSKRFRLFPPSDAPKVHLHGRILRIYPNGRIVYRGEGSEDIQADGSEGKEARQYLRRVQLEEAVAGAEAALERGEEGAAAQLKAAEAQLEDWIEGTLEAGDEAEWALHDDFDEGEPAEGGLGADCEDKVPDHFSKIDLYADPKEIKREFPQFPGVEAAAVAELQEGEMLYLPAGWLHEVQSKGVPGKSPIHLAFNYWFHPPDRLVEGPEGFASPYVSPFWPTVFRRRREALGIVGREESKEGPGEGVHREEAKKESKKRKKASKRTGMESEADGGGRPMVGVESDAAAAGPGRPLKRLKKKPKVGAA